MAGIRLDLCRGIFGGQRSDKAAIATLHGSDNTLPQAQIPLHSLRGTGPKEQAAAAAAAASPAATAVNAAASACHCDFYVAEGRSRTTVLLLGPLRSADRHGRERRGGVGQIMAVVQDVAAAWLA